MQILTQRIDAGRIGADNPEGESGTAENDAARSKTLVAPAGALGLQEKTWTTLNNFGLCNSVFLICVQSSSLS
jgi:hypothetical protein